MAALKQAPLSAAIAFSPLGPWLAAGTVAEGIDDNFSTSSKLEVCGTACRPPAEPVQIPGH